MNDTIPHQSPAIGVTNHPANLITGVKPCPKDIEPTIHLLFEVMKPQKIFLIQHLPGVICDVILIVPEKNGKKLSSLQPYLNFATLSREELYCTVYTSGRLKEAYKHGLLYFLLFCNSQTLIYDDGDKPLPKATECQLNHSQYQAECFFKTSLLKAKTFHREAQQCAMHNELEVAMFMLHQCAEFTPRAFLLAFYGNDQKTHNIAALCRHVLGIAPQLFEILTPKHKEDERILQLLEDAYLKGRYDAAFTVNVPDFHMLNEKINHLLQTAVAVFDTYIQRLSLAE